VLADWRSAPIDDRLRAMLGFLEAVTLRPEAVGADQARALRAGGLSRRAIQEALYVCYLFNVYVRMADSLGFRLHPPEEYRGIARNLLQRGYR
jgi:alkylhydroperoxidase family enzyme